MINQQLKARFVAPLDGLSYSQLFSFKHGHENNRSLFFRLEISTPKIASQPNLWSGFFRCVHETTSKEDFDSHAESRLVSDASKSHAAFQLCLVRESVRETQDPLFLEWKPRVFFKCLFVYRTHLAENTRFHIIFTGSSRIANFWL